jgi:FkbM family methyltransferase
MLSPTYRTTKKILTGVSKIGPVHRKLIVLSKMYLDIHKGFRFSYIANENGETDFLSHLARHYKENFIFFDVGAHLGTYTDMILERFKTYEGHLFDVTKTTFDRCYDRHGKNPCLHLNHAALSDQNGEVEYLSYPGDPSRNGISGVGPESNFKYEKHHAPSWTGDSYVEKASIRHIHLLKIDAEGYDLHVIKGFERMINDHKIDIIQFEYNVKHGETHCMLGDFYRFLTERGYVLGPIRPDGVQFEDFNFLLNDFNRGPNYVACLPSLRQTLEKFS